MTDADRPALAKMLAVLSSTFNEAVDDLKAEGYFIALRDLEIDAVRQAGYVALQQCRFFPRPADLRGFVEGNAAENADVAWGVLLRQIRREGYTGKPDLPDAVWEVVRDLWGTWVHLCQSLPAEGPELLGWHKRFVIAYSSARRVAERTELPFFHAPKELGK